MPTSAARSTRNASEHRASVIVAARPVTIQYAAGSRLASAHASRFLCPRAPSCTGSSTPKTISTMQSTAGTAATQNALRKSPAKSARAPTAATGPRMPPTVSIAWRNPKLAPRTSGGVMSAISESRGDDPSHARRKREDRLRQRGEPVAREHERLAPPHRVRPDAREHLDDERDRLRRALDQPDREHRHAEAGREVEREQRMDELGGQVHAQADDAQHDDAARNSRPRRHGNGGGPAATGRTRR